MRQVGKLPGLFLSVVVTALVVSFVTRPEISFNAAVKGLKLWWDVVVPALLPFFVGGQILMGLGVVHFMGVLLEPPMRPLFNLPGIAGFVCAMGLASGYPIGAVLTAQLRKNDEISVAEGERLMSFANTADPLFMSGAVAVGMFGSASVAGTLIAAHYISAVATGLVLRFWRTTAPTTGTGKASQGGLLTRAFHEMLVARERDARPFGKLFGDCIRASMETLFLIGGFIILFAVITEILNETGFVGLFALLVSPVISWLGVDPGISPSLMGGLFEITLGSQLAAEVSAPLADRLIAASAIIAWAGLSVHAQVAAIIQGTGMSMVPYIAARLVHALLAGLATAILLAQGADLGWLPAIPVLAVTEIVSGPTQTSWLDILAYSSGAFLRVTCLVALGALVAGAFFTVQRGMVRLQ